LISVARSPVRWDILEEHLDEAAFLWTQWEHALVSPRYTLADVADGPEERLKAHVDGLVVGREPVAERLLIPALAHDEPEYRFAAASALLASGERAPRAAVLDALAAAGGPALAALARAFALHASSETTQALLERWPALPPPARSVVLEACVRTGADPGARLDAVMREGEAPTLGAGLEATRRRGRLTPELVDHFIFGPDIDSAEVALRCGLRVGFPRAWSAALESARAPGPSAEALRWLAIAGSPDDQRRLLGLATDPETRRESLPAVGVAGRASGAELCLDLMRDEWAARLAGEAFSAITGLEIAGEFADAQATDPYDEIPPDADPSAEPVPEPWGEGALACPAREAVARWWMAARNRFAPNGRYLAGVPASAERAVALLGRAPMRRRPALALEICARSAGAVDIDVTDWARAQQRGLAGVGRVKAVAFEGPVGGQR